MAKRYRNSGSLLSLLWLVALTRRRFWGWVLALFLIGLFQLVDCSCRSGLVFATFNIENFPKSASQAAGAFEAIRETGAAAIGVQEITDPAVFEREARERLGDAWSFSHSGRPAQRLGVLYDGRVFDLVSTRLHSVTELYEGAKPAFEATLRSTDGKETVFMVVHLKAGGDGGAMRARQLGALAPIAKGLAGRGRNVIVAGDFNATGPEDIVAIRSFADTAELNFASEDVPCTSYWSRRDGCLGVALDHVLTSSRAAVRAEGPCRSEGCAHKDACPVFREVVSDHCPVRIAL